MDRLSLSDCWNDALMTTEITREYVDRHVELLNDGVRTGNFDPFVATFAEDAVMRFEGVAAGPFCGPGRNRRRVPIESSG